MRYEVRVMAAVMLWLSLSCGREGDEDIDGRTEVKVVKTDCEAGADGADGATGEAGKDGEDGVDGEAGVSGPKGDTGPQGRQGESGMDGSDCRLIRELVYDKDGELRENRCDIYLSCGGDEVFISRVREACE